MIAGLAAGSSGLGFFDRITRGFRLMKVSWQVLKLDPELMAFPIIAGVLSLVLGLLIATQVAGTAQSNDLERTMTTPVLWLFYFSLYLVGCCCQASVVAAALMRFSGRDPSLADGARVAFRKIVPLAVWAAISSTVALVLRAIEERSRLAANLVNIAWSAVTFFVIPVIIVEDLGAGKAVSRSNRLFRERWGETLTGTFGMGVAFALLMFGTLVLGATIATVSLWAGIIFVGVTMIALVVVGSTLSAIFNAALYQYAVGGPAPVPFSETLLAQTFSARGFKPVFA